MKPQPQEKVRELKSPGGKKREKYLLGQVWRGAKEVGIGIPPAELEAIKESRKGKKGVV